ncbi:hypothetical protein BH11PSE8_BH11PSE8_01250 [soil metagenome]
MWKSISFGIAVALLGASATSAELTDTEARWLRGAWPVITYARQARLPLDIVVHPQPTPGAAPLAMAYVKGRCKLVLSMRGNPEAESTLESIEPDLLDTVLELMAAHELGHCRRYLDNAWNRLPAGFVGRPASPLKIEHRDASALPLDRFAPSKSKQEGTESARPAQGCRSEEAGANACCSSIRR